MQKKGGGVAKLKEAFLNIWEAQKQSRPLTRVWAPTFRTFPQAEVTRVNLDGLRGPVVMSCIHSFSVCWASCLWWVLGSVLERWWWTDLLPSWHWTYRPWIISCDYDKKQDIKTLCALMMLPVTEETWPSGASWEKASLRQRDWITEGSQGRWVAEPGSSEISSMADHRAKEPRPRMWGYWTQRACNQGGRLHS